MKVEFDNAKCDKTLSERGLDFADAAAVFEGMTATAPDLRKDYGEERFITAGMLNERLVVMVWTPRGDARRIIYMRHAHEREEQQWKARMG
ncbi:BrnT family toxin [Gluconobacter albidus]|uniref:BrnT family toxin n=1 Tax=Gluconobacter albidus TaxID=318683 RepID=UPI001B8B282C|nr:BrnT family toxin [Gluconobacter albidus]MBS1029154.1 BrnT family toxin [Gluconobacter albidus]